MNKDEFLDFLENLENIKDEDARFSALFKAADDLYQESLSQLNNEDFEIDPDGMKHYTDFTSFMGRIAKENDGRVELDLHEPREGIAGINAYFRVFWLMGDKLREFCKLLVWATSWSIDSLEDGTMCISVRFTGVHRRKQS